MVVDTAIEEASGQRRSMEIEGKHKFRPDEQDKQDFSLNYGVKNESRNIPIKFGLSMIGRHLVSFQFMNSCNVTLRSPVSRSEGRPV